MTARALCLALAVGCGGDEPPARPAGSAVPDWAQQGEAAGRVRFRSVTIGSGFTCALSAGGTAYCWGLNEQGQLGDGSRQGRALTPVPVAGGHTFRTLSAGREHACALTTEGQAFCWGYSPEGALGIPDELARVPTAVTTPLRFRGISAGDQRTCAVTRDGAIYCWGRFSRPSDDPAGSGGPEVVPVETSVRFRSVETGLSHACGLTEESHLYCWGSNRGGQLGIDDGVATARWIPPRRVPLAEAVTVLSVSSLGTCVATASGTAYCWGRNDVGQLGSGTWSDRYAPNQAPARVAGERSWKEVTTAGNHACGLTVEGEAYCWGARLLGLAAATERCDTLSRYAHGRGLECSTRPVRLAGNLRFRHLSSRFPSCGISTDGVTYCWGTNQHGQLGNGTTQPAVEPTPVVFPSSPGAAPAVRPPDPAPAGTLRLHPINPPPIPGPEPEPIVGDAKIVMTLHCGVAEAVITDPLGRRLGFDPSADESHSEVPNGVYITTGLGTALPDGRSVDDDSWKEVYFDAPADGDYTVHVIGIKAGAYTLRVGGYDSQRRSGWFKAEDVEISLDERHEYRFSFSSADAGLRGLAGRRVDIPRR